tara:strand:- start:34244 stop:35524 length:1281 start_codon:yes stop_codon:yes gene_type:complete
LLAIGIFAVLVIQVLLGTARPKSLLPRKFAVPYLLFAAVVLWAWFQTISVPHAAWAHPFWDLVPDAVPAISADPGQGRHAVMRLLCYATVFVVMVIVCSESNGAKMALFGIAVFSTFLALFGLYAFISGNNPILGDLSGSGLVKATFVNRNNYATYASFGALANLAAATYLADSRSNTLRDKIEGFFGGIWIFALGAIICMAAVALTESRAGAASGVVGLVVFLAARYSKGRWRNSGTLFIIAVAVGFVVLTSSTGLTKNYLMTTSEDSRFAVYPAVVDAVKDRPILGHGLGSFQDVFRSYAPESTASVEYLKAHNTYLELAFGLGVPAALAYLAAIGWVAFHILRGSQNRKKDRMFSCFALGCIATAGFHSFFDFSLQIPAVAALFSAIIGLGYAQSSREATVTRRIVSIDKLGGSRLKSANEAA